MVKMNRKELVKSIEGINAILEEEWDVEVIECLYKIKRNLYAELEMKK